MAVGKGETSSVEVAVVPPLRLRVDQKLSFNPVNINKNMSLKEAITAAGDASVQVVVSNLNVSLLMSSVTGLAAFVEDEITSATMPLFLTLNNVECTLSEDRPLVRVAGPPPAPAAPLNIRLNQLHVHRNRLGAISVGESPQTGHGKLFNIFFHNLFIELHM